MDEPMLIGKRRVGEADLYEVQFNGAKHRFVVSNCERATSGDGGASAVRKALARIKKMNAHG